MDSVYIKKSEVGCIDSLFDTELITVEDLVCKIEELVDEKEQLEEQIEDLEQSIQENYKPISPYEFYGVNEHDY